MKYQKNIDFLKESKEKLEEQLMQVIDQKNAIEEQLEFTARVLELLGVNEEEENHG